MNRQFVITIKIEDEWHTKLATEAELIHFIDMLNCSPVERFRVFNLTSNGGLVDIFYRGWKAGGLIELVDVEGNVVVSGYGTDH